MRLAVVGSRNITTLELDKYIPSDVTEIVSGGAKGVDQLAADYAAARGIPLVELLPQYDRFGRGAPLVRNEQIVAYADEVLAFWDGHSGGTKHVITLCRKRGVPCRVIEI